MATGYSSELSTLVNEYQELGRREAAQFLPPSDALHPDANETKLEGNARGWIGAEQQIADAKAAEGMQAATDLRQRAADLLARSQDLIRENSLRGNVETELASVKAESVSRVVARFERETEYNYFRSLHGIVMSAKYPDSRLLALSLVLVCGFVETMANTFFFENQHGLLGGFVVAAVVSAINMAGAGGLGWFARYKNLKRPRYLIALGWTAIVVFIVGSIYCNAFFAAFRSEYQLVEDPSNVAEMGKAFQDALSSAWQLFTRAQIHFKDFWSAVLFLFGLILSFFAFLSGYKLSDRYPGHEDLHRALVDAQEAEADHYDELRKQLKVAIQKHEESIHSAIQEPTALAGVAGARMAEVAAAKGKLEAAVVTIQRDFGQVLNAYRQTNMQVRGALVPPAYFHSIPELAHHMSTAFSDSVITALIKVQEYSAEVREQCQSMLAHKLEETREFRTQLLTTHFESYQRGIERDAQAEIERKRAGMRLVEERIRGAT